MHENQLLRPPPPVAASCGNVSVSTLHKHIRVFVRVLCFFVCVCASRRQREKRAVVALLWRGDKRWAWALSILLSSAAGHSIQKTPEIDPRWLYTHTHTHARARTHKQSPVTERAEQSLMWHPLTKCLLWLCLTGHISPVKRNELNHLVARFTRRSQTEAACHLCCLMRILQFDCASAHPPFHCLAW